jgi:hypothetical protein
MKIRSLVSTALALALASPLAFAANEIRMSAPIRGYSTDWVATTPLVSNWENVGQPDGCTNWTPEADQVESGSILNQTATDCVQNQQRTVQAQQKNVKTQMIRSVGAPSIEPGTLLVSQTRVVTGTLGNWVPWTPIASTWANVGEPTSCSNWAPAANTVESGSAFSQTATNCQQTQQRTAQKTERNDATLTVRNVGGLVTETQVIATTVTQGSVGTLGNWVPWTSVVSSWVNVGAPTACTNWSPLANTITSGTTFTQTATDCQQTQQHTVQKTERNDATLTVRNVGSKVTENQTVAATATQTSTGTKEIPANEGQYVVAVGGIATQWGYLGNANIGSLISTTKPDYVLNYVSLGYNSQVLIGIKDAPKNSAALYSSIKIEMVDSSGKVFYTISSNAIQNNFGDAPWYVGWQHSAADLAAAQKSSRYIVTLNMK